MSKQTLEVGNLFLNGFNTSGGGLSLLDLIHPVGSIFETTSSNFATVAQVEAYFGGTWQRFGEGEVSVGYKQGDSDFGTIKKEAGSATVALTTDQLPSHNHSFTGSYGETGNESTGHTHSIDLSGGTHTHGMRLTDIAGQTTEGHSYQNVLEVDWTDKYLNSSSGEGMNWGGGHTHSGTTGGISTNHKHGFTPAGSVGYNGSGAAHSNLQPYIVTYKYVRIA